MSKRETSKGAGASNNSGSVNATTGFLPISAPLGKPSHCQWNLQGTVRRTFRWFEKTSVPSPLTRSHPSVELSTFQRTLVFRLHKEFESGAVTRLDM